MKRDFERTVRRCGLPRNLRMEYPGAIYHVLNWTGRREAVFIKDGDREPFLESFDQASQKTGWQKYILHV